jgi:hypothetical protein
LPLPLRDVLLGGDLIQLGVSIHGLCESRDPLQTSQRVKEVLNLCALVRALALKFCRCALDDQCVLSVLVALVALTFQSLALGQLSVGSVMREVLNAQGYELPSLKLLLDQYLCSDVLALTLFLLQEQQMLALLFRELVT